MGFICLAKSLYLNLSKKSSSLSVGRRVATMNVSKKGVRDTFSVPGTRISYQTNRVGASGCLVLMVGLPAALIGSLTLLYRLIH
jgi:hypothetical protein